MAAAGGFADSAGIRNRRRFTMSEQMMAFAAAGAAEMDDELTQEVTEPDFGKPEAELTHSVDASSVIDRKRASIATRSARAASGGWRATYGL